MDCRAHSTGGKDFLFLNGMSNYRDLKEKVAPQVDPIYCALLPVAALKVAFLEDLRHHFLPH